MDRCVALFVLFTVVCSVRAQFPVDLLKNAFKHPLELHAENERQARETQESVQASIQKLVDQISNLPLASDETEVKARRDVTVDLLKNAFKHPLELHAENERQARETQESVQASIQKLVNQISNLPVASDETEVKARRDDTPGFPFNIFSMLNEPMSAFKRPSRGVQADEAESRMQEIADKLSKVTDMITSKRRDVNRRSQGLLTPWFLDE